MKIRIESRDKEINHLSVGMIVHPVKDGFVELPDVSLDAGEDIEQLLCALASGGRMTLIPPGDTKDEGDIHWPGSDPNCWTAYYETDYD
jgi:hypothetical protein